MNNDQQKEQTLPALDGAHGSTSQVVAKLPDGFYFFKDQAFPRIWGMMERLEGRTWRIGEARSMPDDDWDEGVTFYPAIPPNHQSDPRHE